MGIKNDYPALRKSAAVKPCQLCGRKVSARGLVSHLRMGHYKDIVRYYSFLQDLLQNEAGNSLSEVEQGKLQNLITVLEKVVKNEKLLHPNALPNNLSESMVEFGFKDLARKTIVKPTLANMAVAEKTVYKSTIKVKSKTNKDYILEYACLIRHRNDINAKVQTIQEQIQRYKNMPTLLEIELKGIQIQKENGIDTKEAEERWNFYSALLAKPNQL